MLRPCFPSTLSAFCLLAAPAAAQVEVSWLQQLDTAGQQSDGVARFAIAPDGTIVSVVSGSNAPNAPTALIAHTSTGTLAWSTTWTVAGDRVSIQDLAIDPATGDVFVVGTSRAYTTPSNAVPGSSNIVVGRFGANGAKIWERSWNGPGQYEDYGGHIALDDRGRVVVAGTTATFAQPTYTTTLVVLAYDASGNPLWSNVVASTSTYSASADGLALDAAGEIFVTGSGAGPYPNQDIFLTRLDTNGVELWTSTFDGPGGEFDRPYAVALDANSNAYVSGVVTGAAGTGHYEGALVKWNADGTLQWSRTGDAVYPGSYVIHEVVVDPRGDILTSGSAFGPVTNQDAILVKYDATGQVIWQRSWVGEGNRLESFVDLAMDAFGGVVATGYTAHYYSSQVIESDALVVRYDADGNQRWVHRGLYSFPNSDTASQAEFGANGSVVYGGRTSGTVGGSTDVLVARLVEQGVPYCFGDGSGNVCPCFNHSAVGDGAGCLNSLGIGAKLADFGDASRFDDTLVLRTTDTTNSSVLIFQGTTRTSGGVGASFGDGLQCASGTIRRIGTVQAVNGTASYPPPGGVPVSIRGAVQQGTTYHYQARYRNVAAFCTSAAFNQTNGLSILWGV